jgi:hypothetical protein
MSASKTSSGIDGAAPRERRGHPRAELWATVVGKGGRGGEEAAFEAENVSQAGVLLRARRRFSVGTWIELVLHVGPGYVPLGPNEVTVRGRIKRCEPHDDGGFGVAVEFSDLGGVEEEALAKYVRRKSLIRRP